MEFNACDIKKLADLLKTEANSSEDEDQDNLPAGSKLGPGDVNPKSKVKINVPTEDYEHSEKPKSPTDPKAIWNVDEVQTIPFCDDASYDPRQRPEFDIKYRQTVSSEDVFLQLSRKTAMTASCEVMVVSLSLDGECKEDIDLHITRHHLDVRSPLYRLSLPLPHPVLPEACSAEWDSGQSTLIISLMLNRELDFTNF